MNDNENMKDKIKELEERLDTLEKDVRQLLWAARGMDIKEANDDF